MLLFFLENNYLGNTDLYKAKVEKISVIINLVVSKLFFESTRPFVDMICYGNSACNILSCCD